MSSMAHRIFVSRRKRQVTIRGHRSCSSPLPSFVFFDRESPLDISAAVPRMLPAPIMPGNLFFRPPGPWPAEQTRVPHFSEDTPIVPQYQAVQSCAQALSDISDLPRSVRSLSLWQMPRLLRVHRIRLLPCDSFLLSWRQSCLFLSEDFWLSLPSSCSAPGRTQMLPPGSSAGWALPASMWSRTQWDCLTMGKSCP